MGRIASARIFQMLTGVEAEVEDEKQVAVLGNLLTLRILKARGHFHPFISGGFHQISGTT